MYEIVFTEKGRQLKTTIFTHDPFYYTRDPRCNVEYCDLVEEIDEMVFEEA